MTQLQHIYFFQRNSFLDLLVTFDLKMCKLCEFPYWNSRSTVTLLRCYFSPSKENRLMADLTPSTNISVSRSKQLRNDTFFIQTRGINGKIFPEPRVRSTSGEGKILPLITRVCMKNVILSYLCVKDYPYVHAVCV